MTMRRRRLTTLLITLTVGALTMETSWAQAGRRGGRGFHGHGWGHGGPMAGLRGLDLTESQRNQIRALFEDASNRKTHQRLDEARRALREAVESGGDEGTLRQLADDVGNAEGDAAVARLQIQKQVRQILTEKQREELARLKEERGQKFEERRHRRRSTKPPNNDSLE